MTPLLAQGIWDKIEKKPQTFDINKVEYLESEDIRLGILASTQTVASLNPKNDLSFDFVPSELLDIRNRDSLYHLGDINIMYQVKGEDIWKSFSTAHQRVAQGNHSSVHSTNIKMPNGNNTPITIQRNWKSAGKGILLEFVITNKSTTDIEIGYLGIPMIFDNVLHGKDLEQAHLEKVFYDPYIGADAGYLQVVRLHGKSPVLLVLPNKNAGFEAYNPLLDDLTPRNITFEGFHDWVIHSKALADTKWNKAQPWVNPSSKVLKPGESYQSSLKLVLTDNIRTIETTLSENDRPVAVGFPGYVVPMDINADLRIKTSSPIKNIQVYPEGAIEISRSKDKDVNEWLTYQVKGKKWGRASVNIEYENGLNQVISYKIIEPEAEVVKKIGHFLTNEQWYENEKDLFGRDKSIISYDYEKKKQVVEDSRAWIAGLSDEAGAGSWLAAFMKQILEPEKEEINKLNQFVNHVMWGGLQLHEGDQKYGVRKSMFYYEPTLMPEGTYSEDVNYGTWAAWSKEHAESIGRSYNYPHVAAAHWVMYKMARYHENVDLDHSWDWYLTNAYHTSMAMVELAPHYAQYGQMEGTVFLLILEDLKREGFIDFSRELEALMRKRTDGWVALAYPFGSEMPWDSTGQEEVYMWTDYFGFTEKSDATLNAILAYMPTVPHWGYNGSARRYWDFLYGGKLQRVERQLHHYGSALNAIPVMKEFTKNPTDLYLLRVAYGGLLGGISNITQDGFGPAAFHSFPDFLDIDAYSGDYGSGFFGYAINSKSILMNDMDFGWMGFGGNIISDSDNINMDITSGGRNKFYLAPEKTMIIMEAGKIESVNYHPKERKLKLYLERKNQLTPYAYFRIESEYTGGFDLSNYPKINKDVYKVTLDEGSAAIEISF
ncbi:DUF5695 domain-containing protein [Anditalea andensis]|uniref:DUF5695 domain-containing protein n=1 Tax=Anditalea andensis TaxID=1048983 RepID=UPI000A725ABF|nr:DUF5695 domain-containing protein [Anditalea andensis]